MVRDLLLRVVLEHKKDLGLLLTVNGLTWWSLYYIPIMAAIGSTITVITGIVILKKEYLELKRKKAAAEIMDLKLSGANAPEEDSIEPVEPE